MDLLKRKSFLLQITRTLTEGVVGGKAAIAHTKKTSHHKRNMDNVFNKYDQQDAPSDGDHLSDQLHHGIDKDGERHSDPLYVDVDENSKSESFRDEYSRRHIIPVTYKTRVKHGGQTGGQGRDGWTEYLDKRRKIQLKIHNKIGWPNFSHVFMVSALTGDGVGELRVSAGLVFSFSHVFMVSALTGDGVGELRVSAGF